MTDGEVSVEAGEGCLVEDLGNETQVHWSAHRSPLDSLLAHVRRMRAKVDVPVTVADDYNFWNKPESHALADELDFIVLHAHPMWNSILADDALDWTRESAAVLAGG